MRHSDNKQHNAVSMPTGVCMRRDGFHGVYQIPSLTCPSAFVPMPPAQRELAPEVAGAIVAAALGVVNSNGGLSIQ